MMESIRLLLLLLCFLPLPLQAGMDLLSATVPIEGDAPEARRAAMAEALRQVLVKASGQRLTGMGEKLESLLAGAEDQAQEFRYRTGPAAGGEAPGKLLWVRFDRRTVEQDLRQLGLILWESGRPELIPWLALEAQGRRRLADPERDALLYEALEEAAQRRGLVLVLPLMDLQDRNALNLGDLWMVHAESILAASSRYGKALPLVGRLRRSGKGWRATWSLLLADGEQRFDGEGESLQAVVADGIEQAVDLLVQRFLPSLEEAQQGVVLVRFIGLHGVGDYARLKRLLQSLDVVTGFSLERAEADRLVFRVQALGGREALASQLALVGELEPVVDIPDNGTPDHVVETLSYALR